MCYRTSKHTTAHKKFFDNNARPPSNKKANAGCEGNSSCALRIPHSLCTLPKLTDINLSFFDIEWDY